MEALYKIDKKTPLVFAIIGDTQAVPESFYQSIQYLNERDDLHFIAIAGDLTDIGWSAEWDILGKIIKKSRVPVFTVVGNHDGLNYGKKIYKKMFGPLNYWFEYNGYRFVFWNNNSYEWENEVDVGWLEESITHNSIVFAHQPPNSKALPIEAEQRWLVARQKAVMSLHGHTHKEQNPGNRVYVVGRVPEYAIVSINGRAVSIENCKPQDKHICKQAVSYENQ
jgi:3',5'-cyclic AMP phosphodiesterase CpdA